MSTLLVRTGELSFRHRGLMLPVAVLLLLIPGPALSDEPALIGVAGFLVALGGQLARVATIGLAYIIRGGRDHKVYAEELVTSGLYSHCRNPMYFANFLLLAGLALASNSWIFVLVGVPLVLAMHRAIVAAEEAFLRGKFGAQFDDYCARVPRWMPRLRGLGTTFRSMQFDWHRVLVKEYAGPVDWLVLLAIVVIVNVWRAGEADAWAGLLGFFVATILARLALWVAARMLKKRDELALPQH